ncbi:family 16 glycosylhydrolase [Kitasatospora sp. NPDC094015]|uniref:family 16 glycosylhydrolase n=1 Tax=Kitasatospora sp. NPDC094015 TaxID=3155205 RepID=UPI003324A37F
MPRHSKHRRPARVVRRRVLAIGLAVAAVGAGGAAWAAPARNAEPVVVDSLTITPAAPGSTTQVTATAALHSARTLPVQSLTIAVRDAKGANYDFRGAVSGTLTTSQQTFRPEARTFPAGTYKYFVAYKANNTWHNLTPTATFTSDGSTVTPTPSPTPSPSGTPTKAPTATATPKPSATPSSTPTASPSSPSSPSTSSPSSRPTLAPSPTASPTAKPTLGPTATPSASAKPTLTPSPTGTPSPSPSATTAPGGGPAGIAGSWHSVFADEFNGSTVDPAKWTPNWLGCATCTTPPVNTSEQAAYAPSQSTVSGGSLHLTAVQQSTTANGKTYPYRSGMVQSNGKAQFTYGAFEARIYLPAAGSNVANWPAFWTDGQNWPADGENDIMEGLGGKACYHYHSPSGGPGSCAPGTFTGWHTYGAEWAPGSVTYYYDGVKVGQITTGISNSPQYLILNNAVESTSGNTVAPADMQVDYVRVWQH